MQKELLADIQWLSLETLVIAFHFIFMEVIHFCEDISVILYVWHVFSNVITLVRFAE